MNSIHRQNSPTIEVASYLLNKSYVYIIINDWTGLLPPHSHGSDKSPLECISGLLKDGPKSPLESCPWTFVGPGRESNNPIACASPLFLFFLFTVVSARNQLNDKLFWQQWFNVDSSSYMFFF